MFLDQSVGWKDTQYFRTRDHPNDRIRSKRMGRCAGAQCCWHDQTTGIIRLSI